MQPSACLASITWNDGNGNVKNICNYVHTYIHTYIHTYLSVKEGIVPVLPSS